MVLSCVVFLSYRFILPHIVAGKVAGYLNRLNSVVSGMLSYEGLEVRGIDQIELSKVHWIAGQEFEATIRNLSVGIDPLSEVFGGQRILRIEVGQISVSLGSERFPLHSFSSALNRVRTLFKRSSEQQTHKEVSLSFHLPDIVIRNIDFGMFIEEKGVFAIKQGEIKLEKVKKPSEQLFELEGRIAVELPTQKHHTIRLKGHLDSIEKIESLSLNVSPPLRLANDHWFLEFDGLEWKENEITTINPTIRSENNSTFVAKSVSFLYQKKAAGHDKLLDQLTSSLLRNVPKEIIDTLPHINLKEIVVFRPSFILPMSKNQPDLVLTEASLDQVTYGNAIYEVLVGVCKNTKAKLQRYHKLLEQVLPFFQSVSLMMHGATITYLDEKEGLMEKPSFANLDVEIKQDDVTSDIIGRISFESPEIIAGTNHIKFSITPDSRRFRTEVYLKGLPLYPYRSFAPQWFRIERNSRIEDSKIALKIENEEVDLDGKIKIANFGFYNKYIALIPLNNLEIGVEGRMKTDTNNLSISNGIFTIKDIRMPFEVEIRDCLSQPVLSMKTQIERMSAQNIIESLPPEFIQNLEGMRLEGRFSAQFSLYLDTKDLSSLKLDIQPDLSELKIIDLGRNVRLGLLKETFYHRMQDSNGKVIKRVIGPASKDWVGLESIPRHLIDALTTSEDSGFFYHKGFSMGGIKRSLLINLEKGGFVQGGSTLSQQLVKNLFLSREKTISRKLQEIIITWQLEKSFQKEKILELYLNVIEWGPEIFGLREASMHYFGKKPDELNLLESAFLVTIIPNPVAFHRRIEKLGVTSDLKARINFLLKAMLKRKLITEEEFTDATETNLKLTISNIENKEEVIPVDEEFQDE